MNPLVRTPRSFLFAITFAALVVGCSSGHTSRPVAPEEKGEVVGGYVVRPEKTYEGQVEQQRAIARKQERELKKQELEIQDLKRQKYYNDRLKQYLNRTEASAPDSETPVESSEETVEAPVAAPSPERF